MTVDHARVIALAAVLVGICALAPSAHLYAQGTIGEVRLDALAELQARVASALSESVREALSARDAADGQGAAADVAGAGGRQS